MLYSVITTINSPTQSVRELSKRHNSDSCGPIVIVGDQKGPFNYNLPNCTLLSINDQQVLFPKFSHLLPRNHYSRKNIGYLYAIQNNATCIYETDDDNRPIISWSVRSLTVENARTISNSSKEWVNIYRYFTDKKNIWPRGMPLEHIHDPAPEVINLNSPIKAPIQQGLVNKSPDVDAVWRLVMDHPFEFDSLERNSLFLPKNVWSPFNTQSTWWWPQAYALLYIPSYCSFRMCDIWKSFIAQRCLWANGLGVVYHPAEVIQDRNYHDLLKDFEDEIPGYLNNSRIVKLLQNLELKSGDLNTIENLKYCYECLVINNIIPEKELELVDAWCEQVNEMLGKSK